MCLVIIYDSAISSVFLQPYSNLDSTRFPLSSVSKELALCSSTDFQRVKNMFFLFLSGCLFSKSNWLRSNWHTPSSYHNSKFSTYSTMMNIVYFCLWRMVLSYHWLICLTASSNFVSFLLSLPLFFCLQLIVVADVKSRLWQLVSHPHPKSEKDKWYVSSAFQMKPICGQIVARPLFDKIRLTTEYCETMLNYAIFFDL